MIQLEMLTNTQILYTAAHELIQIQFVVNHNNDIIVFVDTNYIR